MKVGMYIRGNYYQYRGKIGIIIKNYHNDLEIAYKDGVIKTTVSDFIDDNFDKNGQQYKTSFNIIDLIEEGDYVNGVEVIGKEFDNFNKEYLQCGVGDYVICTFEVKDIKTILTKEQFESQKYIVESE